MSIEHGHGHGRGRGHDHGHDHGHAHHHLPAAFDFAFAVGAALNAAFVVAEASFGFLANSLALLADAAHNLGDVLALLLAWGASWLSRRHPTRARTYGFGRSSILAALANAIVLLIGVGAIMLEAVRRFVALEPVASTTVLWVAAAGIAVNGATAWLFMSGRKTDLNVKSAYLHMIADAAVSFGVVVAALVIGLTGWLWLDPVTSLVIAIVITVGTWNLLSEAVNLAMDAVPGAIDAPAVEAYLRGLPGVTDLHDLHIWALSTTETALTVHLVRPGTAPDDELLLATADALKQRFAIGHATIQIEAGSDPESCRLAPWNVV